ncbi:hypothetical protein ACFL6S_36760, partial [Candidatus Poribacteria bacterium]
PRMKALNIWHHKKLMVNQHEKNVDKGKILWYKNMEMVAQHFIRVDCLNRRAQKTGLLSHFWLNEKTTENNPHLMGDEALMGLLSSWGCSMAIDTAVGI